MWKLLLCINPIKCMIRNRSLFLPSKHFDCKLINSGAIWRVPNRKKFPFFSARGMYDICLVMCVFFVKFVLACIFRVCFTSPTSSSPSSKVLGVVVTHHRVLRPPNNGKYCARHNSRLVDKTLLADMGASRFPQVESIILSNRYNMYSMSLFDVLVSRDIRAQVVTKRVMGG